MSLRVIQGGVEAGSTPPIVWNRQPIEDQRTALVIRDYPDAWEPIALAWDDGRPFLVGIRTIREPVDSAALAAWCAAAVVEGLPIRDERAAPNVFAEAEANNARKAAAERLERERRARDARRDHQPLAEGGLFDEVRRATADLFNPGS